MGSSATPNAPPNTSGSSTGTAANPNAQRPNDSTNYAGVFAQMLNMMSNQNLVSSF